MKNNIISLLDSYKISHKWQYPEGTEMVYSNWTIRNSRIGTDYYVFFGLQYYIKEYLQRRWQSEFFDLPKEEALKRFRKTLKNSLGVVDLSHYEQLHDLGFLPIEIRAVEEGSYLPIKVPCITVKNTHPDFFWITNMLETNMSSVIWGMINNATVASKFYRIKNKYLEITSTKDHPLADFLNHNFAYRGMMGTEAGIITDASWLLFSKGSDTVPTIEFMEDYYNADSDVDNISFSISATEHSVACAGGKDNEEETFVRMIDLYKDSSKIFSFVCDTWDYYGFIRTTLTNQKEYLISSGCKAVLRPDSSPKTPFEIICGDEEAEKDSDEYKGTIRILYEIFGGSYNEKGYKVLHPSISMIYGEAISPELYEKICSKLVEMGFCITNLCVGCGSFSQTYMTRDSLGQAFKATAVQINGELREIFKDPKTDISGKKSAKGLLAVIDGKLVDQTDWETVNSDKNEMKVVFKDGKLIKDFTLSEIREKIRH